MRIFFKYSFFLLVVLSFRRCCLIKISEWWRERERGRYKWEVINLNRIWHNSTRRMWTRARAFAFYSDREAFLFLSIEKKTHQVEENDSSDADDDDDRRRRRCRFTYWICKSSFSPLFLSLSSLSSWMRIRWTEVFLFHSLISFNVNDKRWWWWWWWIIQIVAR